MTGSATPPTDRGGDTVVLKGTKLSGMPGADSDRVVALSRLPGQPIQAERARPKRNELRFAYRKELQTGVRWRMVATVLINENLAERIAALVIGASRPDPQD